MDLPALDASLRQRLARAVHEAVSIREAIELGRVPRPYCEALKRIVAPFPLEDDSENRLGYCYLVLVEASVDLREYRAAHHWLPQVADEGSFAYVALTISNAGPIAGMEYYMFNYDDKTGWLVQRPRLPKDHPFQPNARRFRRWCQSNGIVLLKPEHLDIPLAHLGEPVPRDARGVVYHWLFGMGDDGPDDCHGAPLGVFTIGKPYVVEHLD